MKRILFFLVVLLPFLAKSQTIITGKYKYTDSLTFAKYKNNSTLDSVLSVDQNGRLKLAARSAFDTTSLSNRIDARVKYTDTANMLIPYLRKLDTTGKWLSVGYLPYLVKYSDTAAFLSAYYNKTAIDARLALKLNISDTSNMLSPYVRTSNLPSLAPYVKYTDTASMLSSYYNKTTTDAKLALKLNILDTANMLSSYYNKIAIDSKLALKLNISDTSAMLSNYYNKTATDSKLALKLNISDTANMLSPYARTLALGGYVPYSGATKDVNIGTKNYYGNAFFDGFTSVAASGTLITLTVSSTPSYLITGSGGQTIKLPDATTLPNGAIYIFNNNQSSGAINVNNNSNTLVKSVPSGGYLNLELIDNSTAAGSWDAHFQAPSNVSWSTNTFDYPGSITSATWNGNTIAINRGGTGASTSGGALTNLGAQPQLNGTGFVKASGTTISYDNSTYLTSADIAGKVNYTDTATMLSPYSRDYNTVHKAGTETITGGKTFLLGSFFDGGLGIKQGTGFSGSGYTGLGANINQLIVNVTGASQTLQFPTSANYTYTFPSATGTLALTSDIPSITGKLNISDTAAMLSGYKTYYPRAALSFTAGSGAYNNSTGVITIPTNTNQLTNGAGFISSYTETDPIVKAINGIVKSNGTTISAAVAGTDYLTPSNITGKVNYSDTASMLSPYYRTATATAALATKVNIADTSAMLSAYYNKTAVDAKQTLDVKYTDTASMLSGYYRNSNPSGYITASAITGKVNYTDTASMLSPYLRSLNASNTYLTQTNAASTYYLQTNPSGYITSSAITGKLNISDTATMLSAYYNKTAANALLAAKEPTISAGTTLQYWRGDKSWQTLNTSAVAEGTNLYFTNARAQGAITLTTTGSSGSATYTGGTLNVPTYTLAGLGGQPQLNGTGFVKISGTTISYDNSTYYLASNPNSYIALTALSAGMGISYNNTTGVISSTITQYTDAMARAAVSFTAGSGAYNNTTGVFTIPTNTNQLTNGANYITLSSLSASAPLSYNNLTGVFLISQANTSTNGYLSSTDWNTFNGKQNALTNPVTGTGTTNYLPKFTGTSTIGNSGIYEGTSGFVSIGNTNSTYNLDVTGTGRFTGAATFSSSLIVNDGLYVNSSSGTTGTFKGNQGFDGANRVYITNNAYIYGRNNLVLTGRLDDGNDGWSFGTKARNSLVFSTNVGGAQGGLGTEYYSIQLEGNTHNLGFLSSTNGGNPNLMLTQGGNVLVGTTTDNGAKLQVNGTITTQGQAWKINSAFAGTPAMGGNVLSISINGTTYYIQLYTTTL
jgi:predicted RecA/RadA family phage recombinase